MRIKFNGNVYDTDCELTIKSMINNGGTIIQEKKKTDEEKPITRTRGRRRKLEW